MPIPPTPEGDGLPWHNTVNISIITFCIGTASGIILTLFLLRKLGKASYYSLIALELFYKITKYKATVYNIERVPHNITVKVNGQSTNGEQDLQDILISTQMGFPKDKVNNAIKYIQETMPTESLENKLREALRYLDSPKYYQNITKEG